MELPPYCVVAIEKGAFRSHFTIVANFTYLFRTKIYLALSSGTGVVYPSEMNIHGGRMSITLRYKNIEVILFFRKGSRLLSCEGD